MNRPSVQSRLEACLASWRDAVRTNLADAMAGQTAALQRAQAALLGDLSGGPHSKNAIDDLEGIDRPPLDRVLIPPVIRVGTAVLPASGLKVPMLLPLASAGACVIAHRDRASRTLTLETILVRTLLSCAPFTVKVTVLDTGSGLGPGEQFDLLPRQVFCRQALHRGHSVEDLLATFPQDPLPSVGAERTASLFHVICVPDFPGELSDTELRSLLSIATRRQSVVGALLLLSVAPETFDAKGNTRVSIGKASFSAFPVLNDDGVEVGSSRYPGSAAVKLTLDSLDRARLARLVQAVNQGCSERLASSSLLAKKEPAMLLDIEHKGAKSVRTTVGLAVHEHMLETVLVAFGHAEPIRASCETQPFDLRSLAAALAHQPGLAERFDVYVLSAWYAGDPQQTETEVLVLQTRSAGKLCLLLSTEVVAEKLAIYIRAGCQLEPATYVHEREPAALVEKLLTDGASQVQRQLDSGRALIISAVEGLLSLATPPARARDLI